MALSIEVDVVLELPVAQRGLAVLLGRELAERMRGGGVGSRFELGLPFPGDDLDGDACEPHVSLFMLVLDERELGGLLSSVASVAAACPALAAEGERYDHNPHGAPELYYRRTPRWVALQRAVLAATEPLRRGRLRRLDPAGVELADLVDRLRADGTDDARLAQLLAYGYDEIADDASDRFNPHVTLAWPMNGAYRVDLAGAPPASAFDCVFTDLAVYGMRGSGTCTRRYGSFVLGGGRPGALAGAPSVASRP